MESFAVSFSSSGASSSGATAADLINTLSTLFTKSQGISYLDVASLYAASGMYNFYCSFHALPAFMACF